MEFKEQDNIQLYTSDYVIDEFLHILMKTEGMSKAIVWSHKLLDTRFCHVHHCNENIFLDALDVFRKEKEERKPMTITDCVVYCSSIKISSNNILTYDERLRNYTK